MFIVDRRALGVLAALGAALSTAVLDPLSHVARSTEPDSRPAAITSVAALSP
jgi:hypothetical protein